MRSLKSTNKKASLRERGGRNERNGLLVTVQAHGFTEQKFAIRLGAYLILIGIGSLSTPIVVILPGVLCGATHYPGRRIGCFYDNRTRSAHRRTGEPCQECIGCVIDKARRT